LGRGVNGAAPQAPRSPRQYGAARARELKAERIPPELAAFLASRLMSGVPQKRDEGDAPAA
jgi:hypothetical protein